MITYLLISAPAWSAAVEVEKVTYSESQATALLNDTVERIIDAYGQAYIDLVTPQRFVKKEIERGLNRVKEKSIARFEYQYTTAAGELKTRIYHSFSGATPAPNFPANSPHYNVDFNAQINQQMRDDERLVTGKISEEEYATDSSYFHASSYARANDAEVKALRKIEQDITSGELSGGGELTVFINQIPCQSCMPLFKEKLANWPSIEKAEISYLPQTEQNLINLPQDSEWRIYLQENNAIAVSGEATELQSAFTSARKTMATFKNFKVRVLSADKAADSGDITGACAL